MEEPKRKTQIIAIIDDTSYGSCAEAFGVKVANIFKATLSLVHYKHLGNKEYFLHKAESEDTSMIIMGVDKRGKASAFSLKSALKFMRYSRIPILLVGNEFPTENQFQQVVLPIDIEKNTKEKSLWASYFSRYYGANIHLLYPKYKDEFLRKQVQDNLNFIYKLYDNLNVTYQEHQMDEEGANPDMEAVEKANLWEATLSVIMLTQYYSLIDWLFAPKEKYVLQKAGNLPVLCLNPRDDLYVLCT